MVDVREISLDFFSLLTKFRFEPLLYVIILHSKNSLLFYMTKVICGIGQHSILLPIN